MRTFKTRQTKQIPQRQNRNTPLDFESLEPRMLLTTCSDLPGECCGIEICLHRRVVPLD